MTVKDLLKSKVPIGDHILDFYFDNSGIVFRIMNFRYDRSFATGVFIPTSNYIKNKKYIKKCN